jgi:hypothetical protein
MIVHSRRLFAFLLFCAIPFLNLAQVADYKDPLSNMSSAFEFGLLTHYTQAQ